MVNHGSYSFMVVSGGTHYRTAVECFGAFFKALNLQKFDLVYSKICPKFNFLSRTSFNFFDILDKCMKLRDRSAGLFGIPGALILGFSLI